MAIASKMPVPTEMAEQIVLRQYLDTRNLPYFRVPNETYTKSWNQKRINKALGVKAGVPDMFVCLPGKTIAIELKRTKGGTVSLLQQRWLEILNQSGVTTRVCRGADEAIRFIEEMEGTK